MFKCLFNPVIPRLGREKWYFKLFLFIIFLKIYLKIVTTENQRKKIDQPILAILKSFAHKSGFLSWLPSCLRLGRNSVQTPANPPFCTINVWPLLDINKHLMSWSLLFSYKPETFKGLLFEFHARALIYCLPEETKLTSQREMHFTSVFH